MRRMILTGLLGLAAACSPQADPTPGNARDGATEQNRAVEPAIAAGEMEHDTRGPAPTAERGLAPAPTPSSADEAPGTAATGTAAARSAMRDCYLRVDGVVQVSGRCRVFPMGEDEYTLNTWDGGKPAQPHFAVVTKNADGTATATWNADPADDRAMDLLGIVSRDGDCWTNERARICVR